jgi:phosphatidylserine/phosphatidylglycerophosphate/cardiolipin synthase-like enzyme
VHTPGNYTLGLMRLILVLLLVALASGCAMLPSLEGRSETRAFTDTAATRLGRAVGGAVAAHPGSSGIYAMPVPSDAFAARVILASVAEKSLDIQYYIWHGDQTGLLLFESVWRAADRGVRVRILLDDANTGGLDDTIAALDAHPNIEVRLYNPLVPRTGRLLNYLTDFARVNRRMHNKSFTADNQVTIVGGRNVGNEYFAAGEGVAFTDLDVIAIGTAARDVSNAFDLYWNSPSAYPAARILGEAGPNGRPSLEALFAAAHTDPESTAYVEVLKRTQLVQQLLGGELPLDWARSRLVRDDPAKTLDTTARTDVLLLSDLLPAIGPPSASFDLVSPYFVPGDGGTAALVQAARQGVKVRVLTNSLAATDVGPVHAGYSKRRCELLQAGVRLYELEPTSPGADTKQPGVGSSGSVQLHAKTFALDGDRIFVGSFNFDQRSAHLNTEMGLVIESSELARRLSMAFDVQVPQVAYEVKLTADGRCAEWIQRTGDGEVRYDTDPGTSAARRAWIEFLSLLPIEWLL